MVLGAKLLTELVGTFLFLTVQPPEGSPSPGAPAPVPEGSVKEH